MTIHRNAIQCKKCNEYIESETTNDFKRCKCGSVAVDGGKEYLKRLGNKEDIIEMSVYEEDEDNVDWM